MIRYTLKFVFSILLAGLIVTGVSQEAEAHCDKVDGPVATAAAEALKSGDFRRIQIWVGAEQEEELRGAYERARPVWQEGGDAGQLARQYFIESAVRLHRASEGMPYTGVKPAIPNPPDIRAGEAALQSGNVEEVLSLLEDAIGKQVREWYSEAMDAKAQQGRSVEAGRDWVDAYVQYIVYVHSLYQQIQSPPAHGVGK